LYIIIFSTATDKTEGSGPNGSKHYQNSIKESSTGYNLQITNYNPVMLLPVSCGDVPLEKWCCEIL
jgi:hypothetical protein